MRKLRSIGIAVLVAAVPLVPRAGQAATVDGYLAAHGDGRGGEAPLVDLDKPGWNGFLTADVLYSPNGYPAGGVGRPNQPRYVMWGSFPSGQLGYATSTDGLVWTNPIGTTLRDQSGVDAPFLVGNPARLAVTYIDDGADRPATNDPNRPPDNQTVPGNDNKTLSSHFAIVYRPASVAEGGAAETTTTRDADDPNGLLRVTALRAAFSPDGNLWYRDRGVVSNAGVRNVTPVVTASRGMVGPSELIFNPLLPKDPAKGCLTSAGNYVANNVWSCPFVLAYTARDAAGTALSIHLAGGQFLSTNNNGTGDIGLEFSTRATPVATEGFVPWANAAIDRAHFTQIDPGVPGCISGLACYEMTFSGSSVDARCSASTSQCTVGLARSTNGLDFTPIIGASPNLTHDLRTALGGSPDTTLLDPVRIGRKPDAKYFVPSVSSGAGGRDLLLFIGAQTEDSGAPRILLPTGQHLVNVSRDRLDLILRDDFVPGVVGIDLGTLRFAIDGAPFSIPTTGIRDSRIGAISGAIGKLITVDVRSTSLSDGGHTLDVSIRDTAGNASAASFDIVVDRTPPATAIDEVEAQPYTWPLASIYLDGTSTESATSLASVRGAVTNPLGMTRVYERTLIGGNTRSGFLLDGSPDGKTWGWAWAVPLDDPAFYAIPGTYSFSITAVDQTGNAEPPSPDNTRALSLV